ncbi:hypothetical protein SAMN03159335_06214 [Burkholderia cepacia]|uniref:hypothetical protein n=1 Tax=Burkholderia cepacia TaxID=292 RepID=UPI0008B54C68|nr:hypothetical protein [Burkholderia cepacia]SEU40160.1 hypothetical protein SAMN03159335_06214 [Burkholderia cepacia]
MSIYRFNDSAAACEACERSGEVKFGDTLVIEPEGVVAVACNFPFAISASKGEFYKFTWDEPISDPNVLLVLVDSIRAAVSEATRLGIVINPSFAGFTK